MSTLRLKQLLSTIDMTEGTPWKKLLLFTLPLLVGNLFQQLFSTVDAVMLGNFVGDYALAAIGSVIPILFLIMVMMMGLSIGAGIMVSQYFGAKQRDELSYTVGNCITLTAIVGVIMMALGPLIARPLLIFLDTPAEIINDSAMYLNVMLWGILGIGYFNVLSGILRGVGDAFSPLLYLAFTSLLNIALNFLFVGLLGWGVAGAALGTVLSQAFTSILCLRRLSQMRDIFNMGIKYMRPKKSYVSRILKLGVPTGASQAMFALAMIIVQPLANDFGPTVLAANIIVMKVDGFVMMPIFSYSNAMTVFSGQNMGAGKIDRISKGTKECILLSLLTAFIMVLGILLFGRQISLMFTQTEEVLNMSAHFLRVLAAGYLVFAVNMVLWGTIRGAGDAMTPMRASALNTVFVRIPTAYLLVHIMGEPVALIYGLMISWVTITILAGIAYRKGKWRTKGVVQ